MRYARLEPDVDDVLLFFETGLAARRADEIRRKKRLNGIAPPRACAHRREMCRRFARDMRIEDHFVAAVANQRWDRLSPRALPRDAPLRMILEHLLQPRLAPVGRKRNALERRDGAVA